MTVGQPLLYLLRWRIQEEQALEYRKKLILVILTIKGLFDYVSGGALTVV